MNKIDLHTHSTASDGTMSPTQLIAYAKEKNLKAIALTDHDTIDGIEEALEASKKYDVEVVPGIEFACKYNNYELHILGFDINYKDEYFNNFINKIKIDRENRNIEMINKLKEVGFNVELEELYTIANAKGTITRAHFAKLLLIKGYVQTKEEAFQKYLLKGCPCYVPRKLLDYKQCIELLLKANGIPVLAHPTLYKMSLHEIEILTNELIKFGLLGIEAIYPLYTSQQEGDLKALAKKYNIKISGGSDFHGDNKKNIDLGTGIGNNINIDYKILEDLRKKQ